jgi:hypothetical protein
MASDEHVAAALRAFAKALLQGSRINAVTDGPLSAGRREQLEGLSKRAQVMAVNPRAATYLGFERIWKEARELGVEVPSEITMAVASAFMQRPHTGSRIELT